MNRDDIIRMAREHLVKSEYTEFGWQECHRYEFDDDELLHFAAIVAAAEREACAKVCDAKAERNFPWSSENADKYHAQADWANVCAEAIRARGER